MQGKAKVMRLRAASHRRAVPATSPTLSTAAASQILSSCRALADYITHATDASGHTSQELPGVVAMHQPICLAHQKNTVMVSSTYLTLHERATQHVGQVVQHLT